MATASLFPDADKILTVSELTELLRSLVEEAFPLIWVTGEVSRPHRHSSGHIYLTLKDERAQLKAVLWRSTAARLRFDFEHGMRVIACGGLDIYPPHGEYKLVIREIMPKGVGALELALRQLKEKLERRGWFAPEHKQPLPRFPRRIGIVTSRTGAAIRDMLQIIPRRWPAAEILLCPVAVQGEEAAPQIAAAIRRLNRIGGIDVVIVGRGGGSIEDLWAFNEEVVAEAIFRSRIPIISAVGHQIDVTLADLVADRAAATPSEAAEIVVPDQRDIRATLDALGQRLVRQVSSRIGRARELLDSLRRRRVFSKPFDWLLDLGQRFDDLETRAVRAMKQRLDSARSRLAHGADRLESLSPLNVLKRGYSVTRKAADQTLIRTAEQVEVGESIITHLARGRLVSRVEQVHPEEPAHGQSIAEIGEGQDLRTSADGA